MCCSKCDDKAVHWTLFLESSSVEQALLIVRTEMIFAESASYWVYPMKPLDNYVVFCFVLDYIVLSVPYELCGSFTHILQGCSTGISTASMPTDPSPQIPQCIRQVSHNAPLCDRNVHTCALCGMGLVHCGTVNLVYRPVAQIWQCTSPISTMHYAILSQACAFLLQNDALWDREHCGICGICLLRNPTNVGEIGLYMPQTLNMIPRMWCCIKTRPPLEKMLPFRRRDGNFKCIFVNENICILIKISLKFVPKSSIDNNSTLV